MIDYGLGYCGTKEEIAFFKDPTQENAVKSLKALFNNKAKAGLFNQYFTGKDFIKYGRAVHMMSAFYLGIILKDFVSDAVVSAIKTNNPRMELVYFEDPWLLCCLMHDFFFDYEKPMGKDGEISNLSDLKRALSIKHTIYRTSLPSSPRRIRLKRFSPIYSEDVVDAYFTYRQQRDRIDHGIAGGYYAFDQLVKNYLAERERNQYHNKFQTSHDGYTLLWDNDQVWVFKLVADAIISHNIYHQSQYQGLPPVLTKGQPEERKLNIKTEPLAFFLSLIDTIEPVKRFDNHHSVKDILENLTIEKHSSSLVISQNDRNFIDLEAWHSGYIAEMSDWMDGVFSEYVCETDSITISIDI